LLQNCSNLEIAIFSFVQYRKCFPHELDVSLPLSCFWPTDEFLAVQVAISDSAHALGWQETNLDMAISKSDALARPREFTEHRFIRFYKLLEIAAKAAFVLAGFDIQVS
jgi:hypothetical protein